MCRRCRGPAPLKTGDAATLFQQQVSIQQQSRAAAAAADCISKPSRHHWLQHVSQSTSNDRMFSKPTCNTYSGDPAQSNTVQFIGCYRCLMTNTLIIDQVLLFHDVSECSGWSVGDGTRQHTQAPEVQRSFSALESNDPWSDNIVRWEINKVCNHFCCWKEQEANLAQGNGAEIWVIVPQATRPPAFPVLLLSSWPPECTNRKPTVVKLTIWGEPFRRMALDRTE